ncbi:hypothetical protein MCAMS1_01135 [biofilm metagenome]
MQHKINKQFVTLIAQPDHPAWLKEKQASNSGNDLIILARSEQDTLSSLSNTLLGLIIIDESINTDLTITNLRSANAINSHTPTIAIINSNSAQHRKKMISLGYDDCLLKPFTIGDLEEIIRFWKGDEILTAYQCSIQNLLDNCRDNKELAMTLYEKLFATLPQHIELIETALKNNNYELALDTTHILNGSVKTCYLQPIEEISDCLEKSFIEEKYDLVEYHFLTLKDRIKTFLDNQQTILSYLEK